MSNRSILDVQKYDFVFMVPGVSGDGFTHEFVVVIPPVVQKVTLAGEEFSLPDLSEFKEEYLAYPGDQDRRHLMHMYENCDSLLFLNPEYSGHEMTVKTSTGTLELRRPQKQITVGTVRENLAQAVVPLRRRWVCGTVKTQSHTCDSNCEKYCSWACRLAFKHTTSSQVLPQVLEQFCVRVGPSFKDDRQHNTSFVVPATPLRRLHKHTDGKHFLPS